MTSVCNVFRPIDIKTGNFLLFSQYVEDLSKSTVNDGYNVSPSKFVCLDLDSNSLTGIYSLNQEYSANEYNDGNSYIPQFFQNAFEESISRYKYDDEDKSFTPNIFATCFWNFLTRSVTNAAPNLNTKIKYSGNIDLVGWEDGFADIILNISSGTAPQTFSWNTTWMHGLNPLWPAFNNASGMKSVTFPDFIDGWEHADGIPLDGFTEQVSHNIGYGVYDSSYSDYRFNSDNNESVFNRIFESTTSEGDSFTFNTIIILYDIKDSDGNTIYTDIPMGIYFTGDVDDTTHKINNPVTIYKSSDDAYGAGTGWSLRICTRFSATPEGYLKVEEVATESGAIYDVISAQLSAVAELIKSNRVGLNENVKISQDLKNAINNFTNLQKTNIPYIGDDGYWYVNGTNTGQSAVAADAECSDTDILSILNQ